jgi:hypothetical protein
VGRGCMVPRVDPSIYRTAFCARVSILRCRVQQQVKLVALPRNQLPQTCALRSQSFPLYRSEMQAASIAISDHEKDTRRIKLSSPELTGLIPAQAVCGRGAS